MLTQEDLKNIGELIDIKLVFLENRMDAKMNARFDAMDSRLDALEENVNALSESVEEIRCTVNVLAEWADKTSKIVKVAL